MNKVILYVVVLSFVLMAFVAGSYSGFFVADDPMNGNTPDGIKTFQDNGNEAVYVDGKPVIRLFSTTWCSHCKWIKETYDSVVKEYVDDGKIIAYHWQLDTGDNTLTPEIETEVPPPEIDVYDRFNPGNSIPTFVFGEKYWRIGNDVEPNGYSRESNNDLPAEEAEFRAVIEELLK